MSIATLGTTQGEKAGTFEELEVSPLGYSKTARLLINKLAGAVTLGDVYYDGTRKVDRGAGVRIVHVFKTVDTIEVRAGLYHFNSERKGYKASEPLKCVARMARRA